MGDVTLIVPRSELVDTASRLRRLVRKSQLAKSELMLGFAQDSVTLTLAGTKATLPATCHDAGCVVLSGLALEALAMVGRGLGATDVPVRIGAKMLHVGMVGFSCRWVEGQPTAILLPLNATLLDVLSLRYQCSLDEIVAAGLERTLFEAEDRKAKLITKAAETLEPLGISAPALDQLVIERMRQDAKRHDL